MLNQNNKQMKIYGQIIIHGIVVLTAAIFFISCEDDGETTSDAPSITLTAMKAPGHGQYRMPVESGEEISVPIQVASSVQLKSLTITKTVNLEVDGDYGNNGVLTLDPSTSDFAYDFTYKPDTADVDQLVGFTFRAENANGSISESDLTLVVSLSPRDNLPRKKWLWKSIEWVDEGGAETIKECEKDNYYLFNNDSTLELNYGTNTASGECAFDGLNVYDSWHLTEDERFFIIKRHGLFSPDVIEVDSFRVKELTVDRLELEIDYDLSWLGEGTDETFIYKMEAAPR